VDRRGRELHLIKLVPRPLGRKVIDWNAAFGHEARFVDRAQNEHQPVQVCWQDERARVDGNAQIASCAKDSSDKLAQEQHPYTLDRVARPTWRIAPRLDAWSRYVRRW
jgi:hypothetical protein